MAEEPPADLRSPKRRTEIVREAGEPDTLKGAVAAFQKLARPPRIELPRFDPSHVEDLARSMVDAEEAKRHAAARAVSPVIEQHTRPVWESIEALRDSQERSARQLWWLTLLIVVLTVIIAISGIVALLH